MWLIIRPEVWLLLLTNYSRTLSFSVLSQVLLPCYLAKIRMKSWLNIAHICLWMQLSDHPNAVTSGSTKITTNPKNQKPQNMISQTSGWCHCGCIFIYSLWFVCVLPWCRTGSLWGRCEVFGPWWRWRRYCPPGLTEPASAGAPVGVVRVAIYDLS